MNGSYEERKINNTVVQSGMGDITKEQADALITAINSGGLWFGGVDGAIQRVGGGQFHEIAAQHMPLKDGATVFASKRSGAGIPFDAVCFVIDDLQQPLGGLVKAALRRADEADCATVTLPGIRTGVMAGVFEKTKGEAIQALNKAVDDYLMENPNTNLKLIKLVFYNG